MTCALRLLLHAAACFAATIDRHSHGSAVELRYPESTSGISIEHQPTFSSFSIEPAFWLDFAGTADEPNELFFKLMSQLTSRGGQPVIRPGGIAMDSMIFDPKGEDLVRSMGPKGEVYRTTVGPGYFNSWSNFPPGVSFVSTLNFGNNSLQTAKDLALASIEYQSSLVRYFELGNEPNHFPESRWDYKTGNYVKQWKEWTREIDEAVMDTDAGSEDIKWWASSATTDPSALKIRPVDLIPAGVDSEDQVGQFSIHSYVYNSCSPEGAREATIENLLNHTQIVAFANKEVLPSAEAARDHGKDWVMGEFSSVACSGLTNVTDTFTQALWMIDTQLTYAVLNASAVHQHQGATLVLQSGSQVNTPGFSSYNWVYPRHSEKHGEARALPSFSGVLFLTEVFAKPNTRIQRIEAPAHVDGDRFSGYALYNDDTLSKLVLLNMNPCYKESGGDDSTLDLDISAFLGERLGAGRASFKRLTAPSVDEKDAEHVSWAGQSFKYGDVKGKIQVEYVHHTGMIKLRGSEAVLVDLERKG